VIACALICLAALARPVLGETIAVPGDFPTIQAGINAAQNGDEVVISPGTYFENINFTGKDITVRSVDALDPNVVQWTIIDGRGIDSVVIMNRGMLTGFTIRNGAAFGPDAHGGGVRLTYAPDRVAAISHNVVTNCLAGLGGGIHATEATVHDNTVTGNRAAVGGGIVVAGGLVFNNVVSSNEVCCFGTAPTGGGLQPSGAR
jgi:hypothetical protein